MGHLPSIAYRIKTVTSGPDVDPLACIELAHSSEIIPRKMPNTLLGKATMLQHDVVVVTDGRKRTEDWSCMAATKADPKLPRGSCSATASLHR